MQKSLCLARNVFFWANMNYPWRCTNKVEVVVLPPSFCLHITSNCHPTAHANPSCRIPRLIPLLDSLLLSEEAEVPSLPHIQLCRLMSLFCTEASSRITSAALEENEMTRGTRHFFFLSGVARALSSFRMSPFLMRWSMANRR